MDETLAKVLHDLTFAWEGLREALNKGTSVESIVLLDMVEKAASLKNEVGRFSTLRHMDKEAASYIDKESKL